MLAMAARMMQASGPQRLPVGLGQVLGQGVEAGLNRFALAKGQQREGELAAMQGALFQAKAQRAAEEAQMLRERERRRSAAITGPVAVAQANAAAGGSGPWSREYEARNAPAPWAEMEARGQRLIDADFVNDGKALLESAKILKDRLEFKDGVWYDKFTGEPVRGGHIVNKDGFGSTLSVGPGGAIGMGPMAGSDDRFRQQQRIGEEEKARFALETVPATGPNTQPYFASRLGLLGGGQGGAPVAAGPAPATVASMAANAAQQTSIAQNYAAMYNDMQKVSMVNPGKIAKYEQIGNLLQGFEGGKLAETGLNIASAANSAGIKIDPKLGNKEAAAALSNEIALDMRSTASGGGMPGAMSDKDRDFLKNMAPGLSQTNEGRRQIIGAKVKLLQRESQVAEMARKYYDRHKAIDAGFFNQLQEWSNKYPIFGQ